MNLIPHSSTFSSLLFRYICVCPHVKVKDHTILGKICFPVQKLQIDELSRRRIFIRHFEYNYAYFRFEFCGDVFSTLTDENLQISVLKSHHVEVRLTFQEKGWNGCRKSDKFYFYFSYIFIPSFWMKV